MKWRHKKDVSKKRAENMESLSVRAEEVNMFLLCTYIILVIFSLTESTTARVVLQQHSRHTSSMLMLFSGFTLPFLFISSPFPSLMTWIREEQHQYPWKMCVNFLCIFFTRYKYTVIIALFLFIHRLVGVLFTLLPNQPTSSLNVCNVHSIHFQFNTS